jgi:allantoin racemase
MKIRIIIPVSTEKWTDAVADTAKRSLRPDTEIEIICLQHGPEAIQSEYNETRAAGHVLPLAQGAEGAGCQAVIIWCFSDPGLAAAREITRLPVLGIGETSQVFALMTADRIGVITTLDHSVNRIKRKIAARGLTTRIPVVRPLNIPVLEYDDDEKVSVRILDIARLMVEKDRVEALILGCGALVGIREKLEEAVALPVIEPGPLTLKQAEIMVDLELCHSKRSFMEPLPVIEH